MALNMEFSTYLDTLGEIPELIKIMNSKIKKKDTVNIDNIIINQLKKKILH